MTESPGTVLDGRAANKINDYLCKRNMANKENIVITNGLTEELKDAVKTIKTAIFRV